MPPGGLMFGAKIPLNASQEEEIKNIYNKPLGDIKQTDFYNPSNIMKMEYVTDPGEFNMSSESRETMNIAMNSLTKRGMTNAENKDNRVNIIPIVKIDKDTGLRWYDEQTDNGSSVEPRVKHIEYYYKADIDDRAGIVTDREGVTYHVMYDSIENMPDVYKQQYKKEKGIDVNAIIHEKYNPQVSQNSNDENLMEYNNNNENNTSNFDEIINLIDGEDEGEEY
jgi:hypothetical protein